jgi:hypothetical protein
MSSPFCASFLLITKGDPYRYKHCPNFASFDLFWIETYSSLYSFIIANQKSVRYSQLVCLILQIYSSSKCKQRINLVPSVFDKGFVYNGLDMVFKWKEGYGLIELPEKIQGKFRRFERRPLSVSLLKCQCNQISHHFFMIATM